MYLKATLGTFDVAATVDQVSITGEGEKHVTLSSPLLSALNRQLQFVTYTNTVFHPKTADTGRGVDTTTSELKCAVLSVSPFKHANFFFALQLSLQLKATSHFSPLKLDMGLSLIFTTSDIKEVCELLRHY